MVPSWHRKNWITPVSTLGKRAYMLHLWSEAVYPVYEVAKLLEKPKIHMPTFPCVMIDSEEFIRITKSILCLNADIISGRI